MPARLLVVDDDPQIIRLLQAYLEQAGFVVLTAPEGETAWQLIRRERPDLVILDLMLPKRDGWDITRRVRADEHLAGMPIVLLTARVADSDKMEGFDLGADDYITKPFSIEELLLKIDIFLRRSKFSGVAKGNTPVYIGDYSFDYKNLSLTTEGYAETLTQKEADLLKLLNEHRNQVVKRSFILETIWGKDDYFLGRSLDVFISRLRKYLNLDDRIKIENIHGVGFKFRVDE